MFSVMTRRRGRASSDGGYDGSYDGVYGATDVGASTRTILSLFGKENDENLKVPMKSKEGCRGCRLRGMTAK